MRPFSLTVFFFTGLLLISTGIATAQSLPGITPSFQLSIKKAQQTIKIDGEIDDEGWKGAEVKNHFYKKFPNDKGDPQNQTDVKTTYDDTYMYFAFTAYGTGKHIIQSLKRDIGHDSNDGVAIIIDPVNQKTNGFFFIVSAYNVQSEDLLSAGGGFDRLNFSWDNKWMSATKLYPDRWTAEIAIPFATLRYTPGNTTWGINFLRIDAGTNEYSTWAKVPLNFQSFDLGYTGLLNWDALPPKAGNNISLIPYITGGLSQDRENNENVKTTANAGFDAKIGLSSALNLDLTVNPDFSQIEVDQQVTNLSRFSIFFPERRTFFLENSDIFSDYGIPPIRPFYSRRIGLDNDGNKIPILFGARLSGNVAKRTRIGIMNMQTGKKNDYAAQNYSAVSVNQSLFKRSVIKGYFLNRQGFLTDEQKQKDPMSLYGRNAGVSFDYSNAKGTWATWSYYNHSFKPAITKDNNYIEVGASYSGRTFNAFIGAGDVGTNYYADMGFIERIENYDALRDTSIRVGYKGVFLQAEYKIIPKKGTFTQHSFEVSRNSVLNPNNSFNEENYETEYNALMKNTSMFFVNASSNRVQLLFPVSFTDETPLPVDRYRYKNVRVGYESDLRKPFSYSINAGSGSFYNGTNRQVRAGIRFRSQPNFAVSLTAEYNKLDFPEPYGNNELTLVASRFEINFSTRIFWTTFFQYNTQRNNFNINSRFQWRYKPMSDLFLVYTDNYFTDPFFKNKNRALVFKMNYWLSI